jgi:hypothetical protein
VAYKNSYSHIGEINVGVPQGSILGPLLFLLYVNDIHNISNKISCILYADDTTIFANGKDLSEVTQVINTELQHINEWIQLNKLSVNISKTSYMVMSP